MPVVGPPSKNPYEEMPGTRRERLLKVWQAFQLVKNEPLKALSVRQPHAGLLACGRKKYETRTWKTKFRGIFLIHAGKVTDKEAYKWMSVMPGIQHYISQYRQETGAIIGVAVIDACMPMLPGHEPLACCGYHPGLYVHAVENAIPVRPIPYEGKLTYFQTDIRLADLELGFEHLLVG